MGQASSRPRPVGLSVVCCVGFVTITYLLYSCAKLAQAKEEELRLTEKPTQEAKTAAKEASEKLKKAAEDSVADARRPPEYNTLELKGLLGCGGFGAVELVEHKTSGKTFALKSISKGYTVKCGMQASLRSERVILLFLDSPFIVKCFGTYNRPEHVCFLLEPCLGGELYATYNRKKFHGSQVHAKFYVASIVFALAYMHSKSVVHRNVKPEDCVLDKDGRLKLCDMGLAKIISGKTYTTCGTPDYFAPEVIQSIGHSFPVDWWTTGVILFELLAGHPPFEAAYPMKIYANVMKGISTVAFPSDTKAAEALIKALLKQNPEERLPMLHGGIMNVQRDRFYVGFDWASLENLSLAPPYVPIVKSGAELANFSASETDRPRSVPYVDDGSGWADVF